MGQVNVRFTLFNIHNHCPSGCLEHFSNKCVICGKLVENDAMFLVHTPLALYCAVVDMSRIVSIFL